MQDGFMAFSKIVYMMLTKQKLLEFERIADNRYAICDHRNEYPELKFLTTTLQQFFLYNLQSCGINLYF